MVAVISRSGDLDHLECGHVVRVVPNKVKPGLLQRMCFDCFPRKATA